MNQERTRATQRRLRSLLPLTLLMACSAAPPDVADESAQAVVGGRPESGFPAVGYVVKRRVDYEETLGDPMCGATLIKPDVAVTAAHCVSSYSGSYGFGVGMATERKITRAVATIRRARPLISEPTLYERDLAIMKLAAPVVGVEPMPLGRAAVNDIVTYVGYGRVTPGPINVTEGNTDERKSTDFTVTSFNEKNIFTTGIDGGNCWGDSGGPIIDPAKGAVLGVLAQFAGPEPASCYVGNKMIFKSLVDEQRFIDDAIACDVPPGYVGELPSACRSPL